MLPVPRLPRSSSTGALGSCILAHCDSFFWFINHTLVAAASETMTTVYRACEHRDHGTGWRVALSRHWVTRTSSPTDMDCPAPPTATRFHPNIAPASLGLILPHPCRHRQQPSAPQLQLRCAMGHYSPTSWNMQYTFWFCRMVPVIQMYLQPCQF